jgi:hypothetical protein
MPHLDIRRPWRACLKNRCAPNHGVFYCPFSFTVRRFRAPQAIILQNFLAGTLFLIAGLSTATGAQPLSVKIVGLGASDCARFNQDIEGAPTVERDYFVWAQGYMSGLLIRAPAGRDERVDLIPQNMPLLKQAEFLQAFCFARPQAGFTDAVNDLYRALRSNPD